MLFVLVTALPAAQSETSEKAHSQFKLRAVLVQEGNTPLADTPCRYHAEKAESAYADSKLDEAERCYKLALSEASKENSSKKTLALLHTNLGAVLRDERKMEEGKQQFRAAVEIERVALAGERPLSLMNR